MQIVEDLAKRLGAFDDLAKRMGALEELNKAYIQRARARVRERERKRERETEREGGGEIAASPLSPLACRPSASNSTDWSTRRQNVRQPPPSAA